ncbi:MAG: stage II sporulation protein R [Lachnospiraceae bacterium]
MKERMIEKITKYQKRICILLALIIAFGLTSVAIYQRELRVEAKIQSTQEEVAKEVLRFHILANSDGKKDQELKMKVKEAILKCMKREIPHAKNVEETKAWAIENELKLQDTARTIIREEGYNYPVNVEVTKCYFPDKTYGDVTFPAGDYEALRIEIGEAKGHNWWCVLYPNLCFVDATHAVVPDEGKEELKEVLTEEEYEMVTATSEFKIKWFFLEQEK